MKVSNVLGRSCEVSFQESNIWICLCSACQGWPPTHWGRDPLWSSWSSKCPLVVNLHELVSLKPLSSSKSSQRRDCLQEVKPGAGGTPQLQPTIASFGWKNNFLRGTCQNRHNTRQCSARHRDEHLNHPSQCLLSHYKKVSPLYENNTMSVKEDARSTNFLDQRCQRRCSVYKFSRSTLHVLWRSSAFSDEGYSF